LKQKLKEYYQSVGWIHLAYAGKEKLKLSVWQAVEAHSVVRRRGSHIF
jgi:hypothetical protein